MSITQEKLAEDLLAAEQCLQNNDFGQAYRIYQALLQYHQTPEIYNNAAICAYNLELKETSLILINQAIQLSPNNPWYLTQYAQFLSANNYSLADEAFNKSLILAKNACIQTPQDKELALVLQQIKNCYSAFLFNYGCISAKLPEIESQNEAIGLFLKSLKLNPEFYKSCYNLACCYININDLANALVYLQKTIELNAYHSQAHFALSQYYQQQNNLELAECHLQQSLTSENINQANALYNYGVLEQKRNNYTQALQYYEKCLTVAPQHFAACYNTASIYHRLKDISAAINFYQKSLAIKPDDEACCYLLASLTADKQETLSTLNQAPLSYVENLFDSYAENFDHELINNLQYKTPTLLHNLWLKHTINTTSKINILDLGCGTGLSGGVFREHAHTLTGVDLSNNMLARAATKNIYDKLIKSDLELFLTSFISESSALRLSQNRLYDLIILADVLVYYGDLYKLFSLIKNTLSNQGKLLFSIELTKNNLNNSADFILQSNGRFAHSLAYIKNILLHLGLTMTAEQQVNLRTQAADNVTGNLFLVTP